MSLASTEEGHGVTLDELGMLREEVTVRLEALGQGEAVRVFVDVACLSLFVFFDKLEGKHRDRRYNTKRVQFCQKATWADSAVRQVTQPTLYDATQLPHADIAFAQKPGQQRFIGTHNKVGNNPDVTPQAYTSMVRHPPTPLNSGTLAPIIPTHALVPPRQSVWLGSDWYICKRPGPPGPQSLL